MIWSAAKSQAGASRSRSSMRGCGAGSRMLPPLRYAVPGISGRRHAFFNIAEQAGKRRLPLADDHCIDGAACSSISPGRAVACGPPTAIWAFGCSSRMSRASASVPRRFEVKQESPNTSARLALIISTMRSQAKVNRFKTSTVWPCPLRLRRKAQKPAGNVENIAA